MQWRSSRSGDGPRGKFACRRRPAGAMMPGGLQTRPDYLPDREARCGSGQPSRLCPLPFRATVRQPDPGGRADQVPKCGAQFIAPDRNGATAVTAAPVHIRIPVAQPARAVAGQTAPAGNNVRALLLILGGGVLLVGLAVVL